MYRGFLSNFEHNGKFNEKLVLVPEKKSANSRSFALLFGTFVLDKNTFIGTSDICYWLYRVIERIGSRTGSLSSGKGKG